jgi:hypothetical protein
MNWRDKPSFGPTTVNGAIAVTGAATVGGAMTVTGKVTAVVPIQLPVYTVATLPTGAAGQICYVSNGADGSPTLAWHNGTNWLETDLTACAA